jgi:hypothetical protein
MFKKWTTNEAREREEASVIYKTILKQKIYSTIKKQQLRFMTGRTQFTNTSGFELEYFTPPTKKTLLTRDEKIN